MTTVKRIEKRQKFDYRIFRCKISCHYYHVIIFWLTLNDQCRDELSHHWTIMIRLDTCANNWREASLEVKSIIKQAKPKQKPSKSGRPSSGPSPSRQSWQVSLVVVASYNLTPNYTVIHKIGTPLYFCNNFFKCCIMLIDLNENYITVFVRKFAFRRCGSQLHIS